MRDHAIVSPTFWTGNTGRQLRKDPEAQRIAFYLMTCPSSNMIGLYYLPLPLICHEVGLSEEGASKGLARLSEVSFCAYDAPSEVVFVKQMARYQLGEKLSPKDNRHLSVLRQLGQMKNCPFYNEFVERYNDAFALELKPLASPSQGPSKPLRSKDKGKGKDKGKEEELQTTSATSVPAESIKVDATMNGRYAWPSPEAFVALYNLATPDDHPKVEVISPTRYKSIQTYTRMFPDQQFWEQVYREMSTSDFLRGLTSSQGRRPIKRGLDWLLQKGAEDGIENCVKTYEGKYRNDAVAAVPNNQPYMG